MWNYFIFLRQIKNMLFNSLSFLVFALIVIPLFFILAHNHRWKMLLVASCIFYMYLIPIYILVLFAIITIDYFAALQIQKSKQAHKKKFLLISICANLGILFFFKYFNFFIDNLNHLNNILPFLKSRISHLDIILPIGLSFHTFQAISYVVEVYRGKQIPEKSYGIYALYVMFFPQLVAGPIERPQNLLHQFHEEKQFSFDNLYSGLKLILWGLFMKSVIADRLALPVDTVFNSHSDWGGFAVFMAAMFFNVQVYCDFAGYSFMAIGVAQIMGFKLMQNFNLPYFSRNIAIYWTRWHISLSSWFKDYVFIPLGGNRGSSLMFIRNILIVFALSGFWHGANYTFITWGLFHATLLLLFYGITKLFPKLKLPLLPSVAITFICCCLTRVFYRAQNISTAKNMFLEIFTFKKNYFQLYTFDNLYAQPGTFLGLSLFSFGLTVLLVPFYFFLEYLFWIKKIQHQFNYPTYIKWGVYYTAILVILFLGVFDTRQFIYFQF